MFVEGWVSLARLDLLRTFEFSWVYEFMVRITKPEAAAQPAVQAKPQPTKPSKTWAKQVGTKVPQPVAQKKPITFQKPLNERRVLTSGKLAGAISVEKGPTWAQRVAKTPELTLKQQLVAAFMINTFLLAAQEPTEQPKRILRPGKLQSKVLAQSEATKSMGAKSKEETAQAATPVFEGVPLPVKLCFASVSNTFAALEEPKGPNRSKRRKQIYRERVRQENREKQRLDGLADDVGCLDGFQKGLQKQARGKYGFAQDVSDLSKLAEQHLVARQQQQRASLFGSCSNAVKGLWKKILG